MVLLSKYTSSFPFIVGLFALPFRFQHVIVILEPVLAYTAILIFSFAHNGGRKRLQTYLELCIFAGTSCSHANTCDFDTIE